MRFAPALLLVLASYPAFGQMDWECHPIAGIRCALDTSQQQGLISAQFESPGGEAVGRTRSCRPVHPNCQGITNFADTDDLISWNKVQEEGDYVGPKRLPLMSGKLNHAKTDTQAIGSPQPLSGKYVIPTGDIHSLYNRSITSASGATATY